jgi:hypothetical protein
VAAAYLWKRFHENVFTIDLLTPPSMSRDPAEAIREHHHP